MAARHNPMWVPNSHHVGPCSQMSSSWTLETWATPACVSNLPQSHQMDPRAFTLKHYFRDIFHEDAAWENFAFRQDSPQPILFSENYRLRKGLQLAHLFQALTQLLTQVKTFCCCFTNWPQYTEGKERPKKKADRSRLVGGRFNKLGT